MTGHDDPLITKQLKPILNYYSGSSDKYNMLQKLIENVKSSLIIEGFDSFDIQITADLKDERYQVGRTLPAIELEIEHRVMPYMCTAKKRYSGKIDGTTGIATATVPQEDLRRMFLEIKLELISMHMDNPNVSIQGMPLTRVEVLEQLRESNKQVINKIWLDNENRFSHIPKRKRDL